MKNPPVFLIYLLLVFFITSSACSFTSRLGRAGEPTPAHPRRFVVLPPASTTSAASPGALPEQVVATPTLPIALLPSGPRPRLTASPTPGNFLAQLTEMLGAFDEPTATPTRVLQLASLPTIPPTPTATSTPTATLIPTETPLPTATPILAPTDTPTFVLTDTPVPPPPTNTPVPPAAQPQALVESAFTSPVDTPEEGDTPQEAKSGFDFLLGEFYNSPTTNSFMVIYVAVVDAKEIPIGDMKIVGTRLDHNLTYESPLSTWYYEGYNAPGEVIKSGNVKFEPPGGIETTKWVLHLEDANGARMSDDVPFDTNQDDKQWYFIKFKRTF